MLFKGEKTIKGCFRMFDSLMLFHTLMGTIKGWSLYFD